MLKSELQDAYDDLLENYRRVQRKLTEKSNALDKAKAQTEAEHSDKIMMEMNVHNLRGWQDRQRELDDKDLALKHGVAKPWKA